MNGEEYLCKPPRVGVAAKMSKSKGTINTTKKTQSQIDFLNWCFMRGEKAKGDKLSPHNAAELMKIHGLTAGEQRFIGDKYWENKNKRTFRTSELLDHWRIRPFFSQKKTAFQKKMATILIVPQPSPETG